MEKSFRVRHLHSVSVRNLNVSTNDLNKSTVFFALSTVDKDNLGYFYESSKCDNILNPYWENLDLSYESIKRFSFLDNFVISFFVNKNSKNKLIVEINVSISGLSPLINLPFTLSKNDENRFLFQFNNNMYSFNVEEASPGSDLSVDISRKSKVPKPLYCRETIFKFMSMLSPKYQQTVISISSRRTVLETQIYNCKDKIMVINAKKNHIATIQSQIQLAQKQWDARTKELFQTRLANTLLKEKVNKVEENSVKVVIDTSRTYTILKRHRPAYEKISKEYMLRIYQLIHELARIFPITPTVLPLSFTNNSNYLSSSDSQSTTITIKSSDKLSIVNLHLPNTDKDIIFTQDAISFAALGMVFRLLTALSQIYDIPLRYPLIASGMKIMIRDNILEIDDQERNFLLIKNSSENYRLQYAIYLLNLNIVAIRGYFSLVTKNPDRTLWNINTLIEGKNRVFGSGSTDSGSNSNLTISTNNTQAPPSANSSPRSSRTSHKLSPLVTKSFSAINL